MPEVDGANLGSLIINDPDIPDCPLVIYSSSANKGDARIFEKIGFSGYLTKPSLLDVLHDTLECVLGEYNNPSSGSSGIITKYDVIDSKPDNILKVDFKGTKVLLAEDNQVNQKVAIGLLRKNNLHVTIANDGQEAIDLFKKNKFEIVLMDCQMPIKDGFVATEEINLYQKKSTNPVPVIALTANVMESEKEKCIKAGMQGFVAKPYTAEILLSTIHNILKKEDVIMNSSPTEQAEPSNDTLDLNILSGLKEIMEDDFAELIPAFMKVADRYLLI